MRISDWSSDVCSSDLFVSATPGSWEMEQTSGVFTEQVIRPTGLVDPPVPVRPVEHQVDDLIYEAKATAAQGYRTLVTTLTGSEEHTSEIQTLLRTTYAVFCLKNNT